jgi:uncharacterized circularly permuted ATP-grasp superfamily protein
MAAHGAFDEIFGQSGDTPRAGFEAIARWIRETSADDIRARQGAAEAAFRQLGITFAVYGDDEAAERIIPFDIIPRLFTAPEWSRLSAGLEQRVHALNAFMADIYGDRRILKEGIVPEELIMANSQFCIPIVGHRPPHGIFTHISGIDLVRTGADEFYVLEDNARTPSGVSYMLENREAMIRLCPELFDMLQVQPVDRYPDSLRAMLISVAPPRAGSNPVCVLLTPGRFNSAYYEHSFLADNVGIELVESSDLQVDDDVVWMMTIMGRKKVDVIYRRIDDDFLDPLVFRPDSMLGVPGLMAAYLAGNVTIVNAPGTGIADDKAIYSYMPEIVKFYAGEEAKLPIVQTWRCREPGALKYVLDHMGDLVIKLVDGSGGYGMLVGPTATKAEIETFRGALLAQPWRYIAQPTLALSTVPTLVDQGIAPRHVDFRPFILAGSNGIVITPGGLTRVALAEGSLVVNSSQGGGTKDSLVLMEPGAS